MLDIQSTEKVDVLKMAYQAHRKEIAYYRNNSYQIMSWVIGLHISLSAAGIFVSSNARPLVGLFLSLAVATTMYLHKNYRTYCDRWKHLSAVERALGFFEPGAYIDGKTLMPTDKNPPTVTYRGTLFFTLSVWIVSLSSCLAVWFK